MSSDRLRQQPAKLLQFPFLCPDVSVPKHFLQLLSVPELKTFTGDDRLVKYKRRLQFIYMDVDIIRIRLKVDKALVENETEKKIILLWI